MPMKCEDCKGSGRYVGFRAVEDCRACGGSGIGRLEFDVGLTPPESFRGVYTQESAASRLKVSVRMDGTVELRIDEPFVCDVANFAGVKEISDFLAGKPRTGFAIFMMADSQGTSVCAGSDMLRISRTGVYGSWSLVEAEADIPKILEFLEECASR